MALLLLSCASSPANKAPAWVTNPQAAYPERDWLSVVKTGRDRDAAESAALNALAQTFRVDVQGITRSEQVLVNKVQRTKGKETSEFAEMRSLSTELTALSEVSGLIGVQRDVWTGSPDGLVYANARLNRAEGAARYRTLIQENEALIGMLKASAERTGGTFAAYESLAFAASAAELTDNFYTILGVLNPAAATKRPAYGNAEAIRAFMRDEAALIVIQVTVTGDVDGSLSKAFASVFSRRGFKTSAAAADSPYTLQADFKTEDEATNDTRNKTIWYVLTAALLDTDGAELLSFSKRDRVVLSKQSTALETLQRTIRRAETVITEGGFAENFDAYLDSL